MPKAAATFERGRMASSTRERIIGTALRYTVIVIAVAFALFPVLFIISSALNPTGQLSTQGLLPRVDDPSRLFDNFRGLLIDNLRVYPFWRWLFNSFIVASVSTVLTVLITALSAYSFSRFRFRGRQSLLLWIRLLQVFPNLLALVALFLILQQINEVSDTLNQIMPILDWTWLRSFGLNSLGGVILVYMAGAMGINTLLMKGFLDSIPREIDESATVDGATNWQIFWQLIFPLIRPILAVVGVLAFVGTFNEFVLARLILRDTQNWTLMVGLFNFINSDFNRDWGQFAAGALVAAVPVVTLYLILQDQIVGGLTQGAVKG